MPHPLVFRGAQFGIQSAFASSAAANIKLGAPGFSRIAALAEGGFMHTNFGSRLPSANVPPGYHFGEVTLGGPMDTRCMLYPLGIYFGVPTPAADGTNGWLWAFSLDIDSGTSRTFFTYENGDANRAEKGLNMFCNSLVFTSSKATQNYSGNLICAKKQRGVTITATPTEIAPLIMPPQNFDVFVADSKSALDTAVTAGSRLTTPFPLMVTATFPDVADPLPRMNSTEDSYAAVMDKALIPTFAFKTTDESAFDALADIIDTGATKFFALQGLGNTIAGAVTSQHEIRIDFCGALIEPESNEEEASAAAHTLTFQNQYDSTWGKAHEVTVVTDIDALEP